MRESHPRDCYPIRSASVLMPTWQGMEFLERVLDSLSAQETEIRWDFHVIDSGSTDGTLECLRERATSFPVPLHLYTIASAEFDHGDTRNQLAARSRGDLLVFLTQDAIPSSTDWLERVVRNFEDPRVGAITCRNVPREDAQTLTRVFCRTDPGYGDQRIERTLPEPEIFDAMTPDERRLLYNFNDVASAIRRELWEFHPFPRTMMGEDVLMARGLIHAGYIVVHDGEATVDHSHDYGPEKMQWRGFVDGKFNAEWLDRICVATAEDVKVLATRLVEEDVQYLSEMGFEGAELEALRVEALELRTALAQGLYEGGLSKIRYPAAEMREARKLRLLCLNPDENLESIGRGLGRLGHEVHFWKWSDDAEGSSAHPGQRTAGAHWTSWTVTPGRSLTSALSGWLSAVEIDVCHLGKVQLQDPDLPSMLREWGCATVADWRKEACRNDPMRAQCDLRLTVDQELRKRILEDESGSECPLDPQLFAFVEAHDGLHAKSFQAAVADAEFRYRALAATRSGSPSLDTGIHEFAGAEATVRGESMPQGPDWLLLMPGAKAEFLVSIQREGLHEITVEQYQLAAEKDVVLAGDVSVDGCSVHPITSQGSCEEDRTLETKTFQDLDAAKHTVCIAPAEGAHLRLCRVRVVRQEEASSLTPPASLLALAEELCVAPGAAVQNSALPRVGIVIPHLQDPAQLDRALQSLRAQDYPHERMELVVVDNSGSLELAADWTEAWEGSLSLCPQDRNLGFASACNLGAAEAKGAEALVFLNDDMVFEPDFLRELVAPLVRGECACTTARLYDASGKVIDTSGTGTTFHGICVQPGFGEAPAEWQDVPRKTLFGCGGAMAIRAEVFDELEGFDEDYFAYYEDLDLGWRLWLAGYEVHYVPSAVGRHHHSSTSKKLPPEQIRRIMVRNSLFTIVKNYDEENFRRVLPAVLALSSRRAFLKAGLDASAFRIEDGEEGLSGDSARVEIDAMGAADWVAIDDLLSRWDYWMEKRRDVQRRRRRTDAEIQRMFLEPLACVEGDPAYASLQSSLVRIFGLDEVFARG